jgi:Protein of unknown function (DUF1295)
MAKAFLIVIAAYVLAGAAAVGTGIWFHAQPPIVIVGLADLAATIVVFIFSVLTNNSSMYDPYWSVAPVPIALFWLLQPGSDGFANPRHVLIFALLCLWAIRLTANWATQWRGLSHEDWRYEEIRKQAGFLYWPASLLGIHLAGWRGRAGDVDCRDHRRDGRSPDEAVSEQARIGGAGDSTGIVVGFAPSELLWGSALLVGIVSLCAAGASKLLVGHRGSGRHFAALPGRQHSPDGTPPACRAPYLRGVPAACVTIFPMVSHRKHMGTGHKVTIFQFHHLSSSGSWMSLEA